MAPVKKIAINGFGRIGRLVFRAAMAHPGVEVVSVNDLAPLETNVHLLKYDTVHGPFDGDVKIDGSNLVVNGKTIQVTQERDPSALPHDKTGAEYVVESTGIFTNKADASKHIKGNVKRVIISAPSKDADYTVVMGVNCDAVPGDAKIISNASCTTNCLAPLVKVLHDKWKIKKGLVTTIHSYTNDQKILDIMHSDLRRARAAAQNMIPTSTGAAKAIGLVMPELKGKLDGLAVRVPTMNVSLVDFVAELESPATKDEVNAAMKAAATEGSMAPYFDYCDEPLVSSDFNHNPASSTLDAGCTYVVDNMVKVLAWYDNEWGYSNRCIDLIVKLG
ncbi:MAG: type I glyceraldehyde-3-phosphate dehydrogenase [Candidatus Sumerlaeia bacterium]|nr:type I glyceraldehyde-3-phosphate dehydrogenase [Candidatus Sumerlaeia bacterium]